MGFNAIIITISESRHLLLRLRYFEKQTILYLRSLRFAHLLPLQKQPVPFQRFLYFNPSPHCFCKDLASHSREQLVLPSSPKLLIKKLLSAKRRIEHVQIYQQSSVTNFLRVCKFYFNLCKLKK